MSKAHLLSPSFCQALTFSIERMRERIIVFWGHPTPPEAVIITLGLLPTIATKHGIVDAPHKQVVESLSTKLLQIIKVLKVELYVQ